MRGSGDGNHNTEQAMVDLYSRLREQGRRVEKGAFALVADPVEAVLNLQAKVAERDELRTKRTKGVGGFMPWPPCPYDVDEDWEKSLHQLLGAPWPCPAAGRFWQVWSRVIESLEARGYALGRGAFAGWGDAEPGMARAVWCLTVHLRPLEVVETGVARGITSRLVLEALAENQAGHLWSIDLPPPRDRHVHPQIGSAVPADLRGQWTYVRGSSRRRLRRLLGQLEGVDLFIHDSRHSQRNLLFELQHAWRHLKPGGAVVADDVDLNCGFHSFGAEHRDEPSVVCRAEPLQPDPGRQDDRGVFAVIRKS
jgi:methyltransferase family protein